MVTEQMGREFIDVSKRFTYTRDPGRDRWRIHTEPGPFKGDCEDFALTLLWQLSGRSRWRMWWNIITLRAMIWHTIAYNGEQHAVLWYRGYWADNMTQWWYRTHGMRHRRVFPWVAPLLAVKFLIS